MFNEKEIINWLPRIDVLSREVFKDHSEYCLENRVICKKAKVKSETPLLEGSCSNLSKSWWVVPGGREGEEKWTDLRYILNVKSRGLDDRWYIESKGDQECVLDFWVWEIRFMEITEGGADLGNKIIWK